MDEFEQIETAGTEAEIMSAKPPQPSTKSKKMMLLIVFIVLLFLGIVGAIVWAVFGNSHGENMAEDYIGNGCNGEADTEERPEDEIIELGVDDELVQKIYHQFDGASNGIFGGAELYVDKNAANGNLSDKLMKVIAFSALENSTTRTGDYSNKVTGNVASLEPNCYSGDKLKAKVLELFGKEIELQDGERIGGQGSFCDGAWEYKAYYNELWSIDAACGSVDKLIIREPYAAERALNHLYVYEVAVYDQAMQLFKLGDDTLCGGEQLSADDIHYNNLEEYLENIGSWILEQKDQLDKFKWTFVWNGENYVFEKLERI